MSAARIELVRLTTVDVAAVRALLNEPRNARHMPLAAAVTTAGAAEWVAAKDAQWATFGYGPWAVLVDGEFAGWGGFQHEDDGADFALVLAPASWGHGAEITRRALAEAFGALGLDAVTIALPPTRRPARAMARFGFVPDGQVSHGGARFPRYRLTRAAWRRTTSAEGPADLS